MATEKYRLLLFTLLLRSETVHHAQPQLRDNFTTLPQCRARGKFKKGRYRDVNGLERIADDPLGAEDEPRGGSGFTTVGIGESRITIVSYINDEIAVLWELAIMRHDFHSFGLCLCNQHSIKWVAVQQRQSSKDNGMPRIEFKFLNTALFCSKPDIIRRKRHQHSVLLMFDGNFGNADRTEKQLIHLIGKNTQGRVRQRLTLANHPQ